MKISRRFTKAGQNVYDSIEWTTRSSRISNSDGSTVFEMKDAAVPASWSQLATDIVVSKYFRKAGVPQVDANGNAVLDANGRPVLGSESSVRQVVHRLAGCWQHWGEKFGYFSSRRDAEAFYDELAWMLLNQVAAPNSPQLTVGLIKGGINTNVVPDRVTFRLDRRMIPEESSVEVEAELRRVIEEAGKAMPEAKVTVRRILVVEPLAPLPGGARLTELLCQHATTIMGEPVGTKGVPLYTDAPHYSSRGIPTVLYGAGPHSIEEANAHRADERLPLSDQRKATEVVALTLHDLLTTETR